MNWIIIILAICCLFGAYSLGQINGYKQGKRYWQRSGDSKRFRVNKNNEYKTNEN